MRLSLIALIPLNALFSVVHAHSDYSYEAREHIDELETRAFDDSLLATRQDLADLSTRDLLDELEDRLQRRKKKEPTFECVRCGDILVTGKEGVAKHYNDTLPAGHMFWRQLGISQGHFYYVPPPGRTRWPGE
ncbi:hypothetical protein DFP72DRAFT_1119650 [Ephemerocybe angulata]|uniref:Uncharacterized protein n=1 Tax=Ephemerocybe angulata TaxID=980116 RepID=A0A8H6M7B4_9AGAR|nr:hypothetical protein DFP72DRAFT_1119650 [Tulosesus angulatus]